MVTNLNSWLNTACGSSSENYPVLDPSPQGVFLAVILSVGRHPKWSFHFEILFLCTSDQVSTYLPQRLYPVAE